jgi:hypothetical protein
MSVAQPIFTKLMLARQFFLKSYIEFRGNPTHRLAPREHKSGCQVAVATKFCTLAPNIFGASGWNLLHVTHLASRILKWLRDFWEICSPLG